jgi:hypothetical protein
MKISCDIIKDLLPLYHDNVCSTDSRKLIEEHLENCEECKAELKKYDTEIKGVNNMEEAKLLGKIAKKWKNDKKTAFLKGTALVSIIGCILCAIAYNVNGSYIDKDGYLVESFGFIPLGFLFAFIALVSVIILASIAIIRRYKRR